MVPDSRWRTLWIPKSWSDRVVVPPGRLRTSKRLHDKQHMCCVPCQQNKPNRHHGQHHGLRLRSRLFCCWKQLFRYPTACLVHACFPICITPVHLMCCFIEFLVCLSDRGLFSHSTAAVQASPDSSTAVQANTVAPASSSNLSFFQCFL